MEIKATLAKPYTEEERTNFIVEQNHRLGYVINETETQLEALGYTEEEIEQQEDERVSKLTMTALDFVNFLISAGLTDDQIEAYLEENKPVKRQLTYCQNVYCGVACSFMPITVGDITITEEMVIEAFKTKNR